MAYKYLKKVQKIEAKLCSFPHICKKFSYFCLSLLDNAPIWVRYPQEIFAPYDLDDLSIEAAALSRHREMSILISMTSIIFHEE